MKIEQNHLVEGAWKRTRGEDLGGRAQLVLAFGSTDHLDRPALYDELRTRWPEAHVLLASTAGEIRDTRVFEDSVVATAVAFDHTTLRTATAAIEGTEPGYVEGKALALALPSEGLRHVLVLSDGLNVNGSGLAQGLRAHLPDSVATTGGLSGDGDRFRRTLVGLDDSASEGNVVALGFYGDRLHVGYGSLGGWDAFGPQRRITRSEGNVLYELDGRSALTLYKSYLGEHASGLPATGLLFPLSLRLAEGARPVVRTILSVDEDAQSLTFAGDMPQGAYAQLMKANFDRLVDGAIGAARGCLTGRGGVSPQLGLLISCVGRKLVLKQRVEEEVDGVREVLGDQAALTGSYSHGEICPHLAEVGCELHNQTMTITTFAEH